MFHPNQQLKLLEQTFDPVGMLKNSFTKGTPWDSISEFATSDKYCGLTLYPRQHTLLKLVFLETEQMTTYDLDVIEEWRRGFIRPRDVFGVQPDIWERVDYLKNRGYRRFPHLQLVLGRRASKGFLSAIVIAEMMAYLISLDNPQSYYGIAESKDLFCHDDQTEVLTSRGWKKFSDLSSNELLGTVNIETGKTEFQVPSRLISYHYEGDMIHLHAGNQLDALITTDHDMVICPNTSEKGMGKGVGSWSSAYQWDCRDPACRCGDTFVGSRGGKKIVQHCGQCGALFDSAPNQSLKRCPTHRSVRTRLKGGPLRHKKKAGELCVGDKIAVGSAWTPSVDEEESSQLDKDFAALVGFWLAEGGKTHHNRNTQVLISQSEGHPEQNQNIQDVLNRLRLTWRLVEYSARSGLNTRRYVYVIDDPNLARWLIAECVTPEEDHRFPSYIWEASPSVKDALCLGHLWGDGCFDTGSEVRRFHFFSSHTLADDMQALYASIGQSSYVKIARQPGDTYTLYGQEHVAKQYRWRLNTTGRTVKILTRDDHIKRVKYNGMVYCATVPNGTLITKRNGTVLISGNCNIGATSQTQAQRHLFADVRNVIERCEWLHPYIAETKDHQLRLRTPADLRRIAALKSQNVDIEHTIATIWAVALSASSVSGRGATSYCNGYDEFAFLVQGSGSTKSSENIYEDWQPSLGQFKKDALTVLPSSPFTKVGKYFELYQHGRVLMSNYHDTDGMTEEAQAALKTIHSTTHLDEIELVAEPEMLIFQGSSWSLYKDWVRGPELVGVRFTTSPESDLSDEAQMRRKLRNPEKFLVEREGQFAEVLGQYLDPAKVDAIFHPVLWREPQELIPTPFGRFDYTYRIHVDPSKVGANFALCIAHTELAPADAQGERWPHVIVDRLHVWQPRDFPINPETGKHEIDYTYIERELDQILYTFPSTTKFSSDQWNCVHEDTIVSSEYGILPIKELAGSMMVGEVREEDIIVGSWNSARLATQVFRKGRVPTRKLTLWSGVELEATPEHRLWVRKRTTETVEERRARRACLHCGQSLPPAAAVGRPRQLCNSQCGGAYRRGEMFDLAGWRRVEEIEVGDELYLSRGGVFCDSNVVLPPSIMRTSAKELHKTEVDEDVGAFLGYMVSEGYYHEKDSTFSFCQKDIQVVEEYQSVMMRILGRAPRLTLREFTDSKGGSADNWAAVVCSRPLARALGFSVTASIDKVTPDVIKRSPRKVVVAYLSALFEGDGGVTPDGISYWSISEKLIREVQQLLLLLGIYSRIRVYEPSKSKGTHPRWVLTASGPEAILFCDQIGFRSSRKQQLAQDHINKLRTGRTLGAKRDRFIEGNEIREPVTKIADSIGECYDLSVPETECYIANGIVSHNSAGLLQRLKKKYSPNIRVVEETATEKSNYERAEKFKSAVNLGWLHAYKDNLYEGNQSLLELECKFLSEKNNKVYKQEFGPVTTKDLYDSVSVVTTDLLHESLERWSGGYLNARAFGSTNKPDLTSGRATERAAMMGRGGGISQEGHRGSQRRSWDALEALNLGTRRPESPGSGYSTSRITPRDHRLRKT